MPLNFSRQAIFRFLSSMIMISTFLPIIFANLPPIVRSQHVWTLLWFMSLLFLKPNILRNRLMQSVIAYGVVMLLVLLNTLWVNIDVWNKTRVTWEFYEFAVAISIISYYRMEKDYVGLAKLARLTLYCVIITAIMSIITATINPMYARNLTGLAAFSSESEIEDILSFKRYGGGGYGFFSAIVCLFPILIYFLKNNKKSYWNRTCILIFGVILFLALIKAQFFANILISAAFIIISFLGKKNLGGSLSFFAILGVLFFLIPTQYFVNAFAYWAGFFPENSVLYDKFGDMSLFFSLGGSYENTAAGVRLSRFPMLWESFISNPLYGGREWNGHMFWMNKLAVFGLLGTLPLVLIVYFYIKRSLKNFDEVFKLYFLLSMFAIIALGFLKALAGRELWYAFFVIAPGLYYTNLLRQKKSLN